MKQGFTTENFIERARKVHGNKYDYSKTKYINCKIKVCIICPKHGEFWQNPVNHYRRGDGCPTCGHGVKRQSWFMNTDIFISQAKAIHGDRYDYAETKYINSNIKVSIICPKHGRFEQDPSSHLSGSGCPICANKNLNTERFVERAMLKHGGRYDYSKVIYRKSTQKVCIICSEHGEFWQTPNTHLQGGGCPECAHKNLMKLVYGIGVNDSTLKSDPKIRKLWHAMLKRCYNSKYQLEHPTYIGCTVCGEWLHFSNFEKWVISQKIERLEDYDLDKDLFLDGIKIYSPTTCCFLPHHLNTILSANNSKKDDLPTGVYQRKSGTYRAIVSFGKKCKLAPFPTVETAFMAYKEAKEKYVRQLAKSYYEKGAIVERVYEALMNYNITK